MTTTLRRAATAACALLLLAFATPGTNALTDQALKQPCDYEPVSFQAQEPRLGLPGGLAKLTPEARHDVALNGGITDAVDPCDAGVGGGGGGGGPNPPQPQPDPTVPGTDEEIEEGASTQTGCTKSKWSWRQHIYVTCRYNCGGNNVHVVSVLGNTVAGGNECGGAMCAGLVACVGPAYGYDGDLNQLCEGHSWVVAPPSYIALSCWSFMCTEACPSLEAAAAAAMASAPTTGREFSVIGGLSGIEDARPGDRICNEDACITLMGHSLTITSSDADFTVVRCQENTCVTERAI